MREIIFDLVVFSTGLALGVVLACVLFERKRKEVIELIDASLDTTGIKRSEFDVIVANYGRLYKQVEIHDEILKRYELAGGA